MIICTTTGHTHFLNGEKKSKDYKRWVNMLQESLWINTFNPLHSQNNCFDIKSKKNIISIKQYDFFVYLRLLNVTTFISIDITLKR